MTELSATGRPASPGLAVAAVRRLAARIAWGNLDLQLPDGQRCRLGRPGTGPHAEVTLHDGAAARRILLGGDVALGETYADGGWRSPDPVAVLELCLRNEAALRPLARGMAPLRLAHRLWHRLHANSRRGSRRNIAFHYDLGNAFYRLWLDAGMTYSSALFEAPEQGLEAAQEAKIARVLDLLELQPGARVLEIGCGWGGLAEAMAGRGARVVGLTLSAEQLAHAQARLGNRAEVRLQDYRDAVGRFDRVVSIEMIEAVGEAHWPAYFGTLRDRLVPGGSAVLQAITIEDGRFARYRQRCDFIQRHIFPGGMLPCPAAIRRQAAAAGLTVEHVEMFGASYARTLALWRERFHAAWPEIAALGFDARFRRLWDYYLAYCEAGFRVGTIDVGLWRLRRP
jgi:cyclopropane-fatty-acyl-phospholipid synthase